MEAALALWILSTSACLCGTAASVSHRTNVTNSAVTLPGWKENTDYLTRCSFDESEDLLCSWAPEGQASIPPRQENGLLSLSGDTRLTSAVLNVSGDMCVEFWFQKPGENSTDLKMLIRDDLGERELWRSQGSMDSSWMQVFIPLFYDEKTAFQVIFEATSDDSSAAIDNIGIRQGLCGEQCSQGLEFWADAACSTRCHCSSRGLACRPAACPMEHTCEVTDGEWGCSPTYSTCSVHTDPQQKSADGAEFRLEGPCSYILTKLCTDSANLPYFSVEVQNKQEPNRSVLAIQQVNIELYGLRISMLRAEKRRVIVNGIWRILPFSVEEDLVKIQPSEHAITLTTDFQLMVSFSTDSAVRVKLPTIYDPKICGLCGNFNHLRASDPRALDAGWGWQREYATCETSFLPQLCLQQEEAEYESESSCGTMMSQHSPFAACSSALSPEHHFRMCVLDMCSTHGDAQTLCSALQAYASACRTAGIELQAWRNSSICPMTCSSNSHYTPCASGCPAACSPMDTPLTCPWTCEERCECLPGFLLSGGRCVAPRDCGCWRNGQHFMKGETFMEGDCEAQCQCIGGSDIRCVPTSCSKDEVCKSRDGVLGCFPSSTATCQAFGDPHYITFDGKLYDFQGACNYTLATTCGHSTRQFNLTVRNENRGNPAWSAINSVALSIHGLHIALRKHRKVYVNGNFANLPVEPSSEIKVFLNGPYVQIDSTFGVRLLFDGEHFLFLQVDERYRGEVCGLCGTYSENQFEDFVKLDGELVSRPDEFANSWRTEDADWECLANPPPLPKCDTQLETAGDQQCSILFEEPFKACHWFVNPKLYVTSCVLDYCATLGDGPQLCTSLESYAAACHMVQVELGDWKEATICANFTQRPTDAAKTTPSQLDCALNCNFEEGTCGWKQLITDSFDWSIWKGSTDSNHTGPSHDHTTGRGYYMYTEGNAAHYGDSARMLSPHCQATGPVCLQFWYHMYGSAKAMALNLYHLKGASAVKIWSKVNNQGDQWNHAEVELDVLNEFQVIFEGIRGSNYESDMALDDISVHSGHCSGSSDTGLESTADIGLKESDCKLDCSFEDSLCEWNQLLTDSFDWMRLRGSTPTSMTGPSSDHTTGDGYYVYLEGNGPYNGDTARLLSAECPKAGPHCLRFWYHMYGTADTMGLTIYLLENGMAVRVWSLRNNQGDTWHGAQVEVRTSGMFQIIIEGRRGTDERSDVALDDVSLSSGSCSEPPSQFPIVPSTTTGPVTSTAKPTHPPVYTTDPQWLANTTQLAQPTPTTTKSSQVVPDTTEFTKGPSETTMSTKPMAKTTAMQLPESTTRNTTAVIGTTVTPKLTGPTCPMFSHPSSCVPVCQPTCEDLHGPTTCPSSFPCRLGCVCDHGYVLKQGQCVPFTACGCLDEKGNSHHFGDSWLTDHCMQKCRCERRNGKGNMICRDHECDSNSVCYLNDERKFECKSTRFGKCSISKATKTFDDLKHGFECKYSYVLVQTMYNTGTLPPVYIEGNYELVTDDNDHSGNGKNNDSSEEDSSPEGDNNSEEDDHNGLRGLKIRVHQHTIEFMSKGKPKLDGIKVHLPVSTAEGLEIRKRSSRTVLRTDFGLSVEYDGAGKAEIVLPYTYRSTVQGLCGNFDGKKNNDLIKPDGNQATNVTEFGDSWRVTARMVPNRWRYYILPTRVFPLMHSSSGVSEVSPTGTE
uniref:Zonadhesin-like n=1 Tax=Paramormyrops kingsleyae TaxID=1676925 RepID=A0A3B3RVV7_9TELE|nr:zonadhesin-like [Paramormyrops kingsleyae]